MGVIPDDIIEVVLLVAFGFYNFMGLVMFIMGIVYQSSVGAIGTSGTYMILLGLCFLVVGSIAIWAALSKNWKVLFVIECFNVFLFVVLYYLIIICLLMATGTTDPVRRTTEENWDEIKPTLTIPGSNPDDTGGSSSYCESQAAGEHCTDFFRETRVACVWTDELIMRALNNCTHMKSATGFASVHVIDGGACETQYNLCTLCEESCRETQIADLKDALTPASYFCLFLTLYLVVTIVWNNIMISYDAIEGRSRVTGLVLNGLLGLFSFIIIVMGTVAAIQADDKCPSASDGCVPSSLNWIIFMGFMLLGQAALAAFGAYRDDLRMVVAATITMVVLAIFLVLLAILLGVSTGATMDDMGYYYDTQYPKLRNAYELADNSYCRVSKEECTETARHGAPAHVRSDGDLIEPDVVMPYESMWLSMYAEAAREAALDEYDMDLMEYVNIAPVWLAACATTGICVYCEDLYDRIENYKLGVWDLTVDTATITAYAVGDEVVSAGGALPGTVCDRDGEHSAESACVERAPNFVWNNGMTGAPDSEFAPIDTTGGGQYEVMPFDSPLTKCMGNSATEYGANEKCIQMSSLSTADGPCPNAVQACYTSANVPANFTDAMGIAAGYGSGRTCNCAQHCKQYLARCSAGWGDGNSLTVLCMSASFPLAVSQDDLTGCANISELVAYDYADSTRQGWNDFIHNYTYWDAQTKSTMPYCEEALLDHVNDPKYCSSNSDTISAGYVDGYTDDDIEECATPPCPNTYQLYKMDTYQANCGDCSAAWTPFSFTLGSDEETQRKCLNYFVGHMQYECNVNGGASCQDEFRGTSAVDPADADAHVAFMVNKAFEEDSTSKFCGYSDIGCKAKIKYDLENSMGLVGVLGAIFLIFFMAVIFCTMEAIKSIGDFKVPAIPSLKNNEDDYDDDDETSSSESDDD